MSNVADNIWRWAETTPASLALREGDRSWSYAELKSGVVGAMDELMSRGVVEGQRILLVLPTSAEFVFIEHAIHALGAVAVTVNPMSTPPELKYFIDDSESELVIGWQGSSASVQAISKSTGLDPWIIAPGLLSQSDASPEPISRQDDDAAVLIYTSGTTGTPKGAVLTHANVIACGAAYCDALALDRNDRMGTALPLFHVFGQAAVMSTIFSAGGTLSLLRPYTAAGLLEMAAAHGLTAMAGVPTMWNEMLHAESSITSEDLSALKIAVSGGAGLPSEVSAAFKERFGAQIIEGYGLSESTGGASVNVAGRDGSVGRALAGHDLAIMRGDGSQAETGEVGEVAIRGPIVMMGYWKRPEATREVRRGDWLLTGDLGRMDDDGYLWIVDRKKDLVIRGGYNVYPREVEEALYAHPNVREAAVIGIPDSRLGEEIAAVIAPQPGCEIDPMEMRLWLGERLTSYKVPRIYQFVDELPKGATGKIIKRALDPSVVLAQGARTHGSTGTRGAPRT